MKKHRLKKYLKLVFLLFSIPLLLVNCEKDILIEEETTNSSGLYLEPKVKTLSYENTGQVFNRLKNEFHIEQYTDLQQQTSEFARTTQDTLGITIYTDEIKEVTLGNYTSYTMRIASSNTNNSKFYNLTIEDKNGESGMFITKYNPTVNWLNDTNKVFEGIITTMRTNDFTDVFDVSNDDESNDSNGDGSNHGQSSTNYPTDCNGMVVSTTVLTGYPCGCGHWPGQTCLGSTCGAPQYPGYEYVTTYECIGHTGSIDTGNTGNTNNNTNSGGGGSSSGNGDGTPPDNTPITVLLPPGEECENPPPGDLNGDCQLDAYETCLLQGNNQEVCNCVADCGTHIEWQEHIKCERLNRLVQTDGLGSNILPVVNQLRTKLSAGNNEWSISYKNVWSEDGRKNVPDDNGIREGTSPTRSIADYGTTWVGFIHTHPEGGYSIFSWLDLRVLKLLYTDSHDDFNDEIFIMAVAPNNITYALRVDNIQTLIDKIDEDMQNVDGNNDKEKRDDIMKEMAEDYRKSTNLEQTFLNLFGDYGISLYEATDANLSNWKQLQLDENDNETVTETPCN